MNISNNIYLKNFKLNEEGSFSMTKPFESLQIVNLMSSFMVNYSTQPLFEKIITDATACIGGDLIRFSKHFKHVNGIEIFKENYDILTHNVNFFGCTNVSLYNMDYLNIYDTIEQDIIYFDPQWGGKDYKMKKSVVLKVGNMELWKLLLNIKNLSLAKFVFIKAPVNVCLDNINYDTIHTIYNKSKIPSFKLVCIKV